MSAESYENARANEAEFADGEVLAIEAKAGSREARNALYMQERSHLGRLAGRARRYLRNASWAYAEPPITHEDIEQQAFIIFCELLYAWEPEEQTFRAFLAKRMPGRLMHYVRDSLGPRRIYSPGREAAQVIDEERAAERAEAPAGREPWDDVAKRLHLEGLPYRLRTALMLRYWDDLPSGEIAERTGRSRRSVNREVSKAVARAREKVLEGWEHAG